MFALDPAGRSSVWALIAPSMAGIPSCPAFSSGMTDLPPPPFFPSLKPANPKVPPLSVLSSYQSIFGIFTYQSESTGGRSPEATCRQSPAKSFWGTQLVLELLKAYL